MPDKAKKKLKKCRIQQFTCIKPWCACPKLGRDQHWLKRMLISENYPVFQVVKKPGSVWEGLLVLFLSQPCTPADSYSSTLSRETLWLKSPFALYQQWMKTLLGMELKGLGFSLNSWWCLYKRDIQEWIQFLLYELLVLTSGCFSLQVLLSSHQKSIVAHWKSPLFCEY